VLYRAALASDGPRIEVSHIVIPNHDGKLAAPDRVAIDAVNLLKRYGGNVSAAARAARVPRTTFRGWLSRASSCHIQK
jgi:transcriptional regulator of acetoin/glycerol metabolism